METFVRGVTLLFVMWGMLNPLAGKMSGTSNVAFAPSKAFTR